MPENITALIAILGISAFVFSVIKKLACEASAPQDFYRRRNLWIGITVTAFLAYSFWIFIIVTTVMLIAALNKESNNLALYFQLMFVVPQMTGSIPVLFTIDIVRLLALVVLLPAYFSLRAQKGTVPFGNLATDKLLVGFVVLQFLLLLQATSATDAIRQGIFYAFTDIFLPYYAASRLPVTLKKFRDTMMAFAIACLMLAVVAMFEYGKHWMLYDSLPRVLSGADRWGWGYLSRGESIRATASAGQPIPLGYILTIGIGFMLYLRSLDPKSGRWRNGLIFLLGGLLATVSRGPWAGAIALFLAFIATSPNPGKGFLKLGMWGIVVIPITLATPFGKKIIDLIPFVGTVDPQNTEYRQLFVQQAFQVIKHHPWLGVYDYVHTPEMAPLVTLGGFIDTLNVFVTVALAYGLIGLFLYGGFFANVIFRVFNEMRKISDRNDERYQLGRALLVTLIGMAVILNTISGILIVPLLYWSIAGLGVAYANMMSQGDAVSAVSKPEKPVAQRGVRLGMGR